MFENDTIECFLNVRITKKKEYILQSLSNPKHNILRTFLLDGIMIMDSYLS